jgi:hypothetical protein
MHMEAATPQLLPKTGSEGAPRLESPATDPRSNALIREELALILRSRILRVTLRLADGDGFQLWSVQFDQEADRKHLFRLMNKVASAVMSRLRAEDFCSIDSTTQERTTSNVITASILATELCK